MLLFRVIRLAPVKLARRVTWRGIRGRLSGVQREVAVHWWGPALGTVLHCPRLLQLQGCYNYRTAQMEVNHEVMLLAGAELLGFVCL